MIDGLIPSCPGDLLPFRAFISVMISCSFIGSKKKDFSTGFFRYLAKLAEVLPIFAAVFLPTVQKCVFSALAMSVSSKYD